MEAWVIDEADASCSGRAFCWIVIRSDGRVGTVGGGAELLAQEDPATAVIAVSISSRSLIVSFPRSRIVTSTLV
jgi:hypothetical protein